MKKFTLLLLLLIIITLAFNSVSAQTVFEWDTATDNGDEITETIAGITVTLSGDPGLETLFANDFGGTSGNVALTQNNTTSVTFTFSQPVVVNSIIAIDVNQGNVDYIFTPTGGSNVPVTRSLVQGITPPINLNWVNVTSFTVTAIGAAFGFDDLSVDTGTNGQTFFEWETANNTGGTITETVNGIGVTVTGNTSYSITDYGGTSGTAGNIILSNTSGTSVTFTFDQPTRVNSILALEGNGADIDYTFTPTGGNNTPVTEALVSGVTAVKLNWNNVKSFTVTSSGGVFGFDNLSVMGIGSPILFDFDTNVTQYYQSSGAPDYATETIDGITATITATGFSGPYPNSISIATANGYAGSTDMVANQSNQNTGQMIVTFSEPVVVNSFLPFNSFTDDVNYTFTPTGGNNEAIVVSLVGGLAPNSESVNINWVGVTSFSITPSIYAGIGLDNIFVNPLITLGVTEEQRISQVIVYPNPVENTLYIKNVSGFKSVTMYDLLGQQVLESKNAVIDGSGLSKGVYVLEIISSTGRETRKVVKR